MTYLGGYALCKSPAQPTLDQFSTMKILFASSEAHPLIKTGGLADVSSSLPAALHAMGQDIRLILPAYPDVKKRLENLELVGTIELENEFNQVKLYRGSHPINGLPTYLIDAPRYFERNGDPYRASDGKDWQDNHLRFALFNQALAALAMGGAPLHWRPDIVHCNDWQTGVLPALLKSFPGAPKSVFTIHNLAYQGMFSREQFDETNLPKWLWAADKLEFYGQFSFIKGGLVFADHITTVSPTYSKEILRPEFGYGLDGLLNHRRHYLTGILNGVDYQDWDPANDRFICQPYGPDSLEGKAANKAALQREINLPQSPHVPLLGYIGRLVDQKGIDLILEAIPRLLEQHDLQFVLLGSGEHHYEQAIQSLHDRFPDKVACYLGFSEKIAHYIEAGSDMFLMPSRFEPCGLNQLYSLRYGTLPIVRHTGGLADSVCASSDGRGPDCITGFKFQEATVDGLVGVINEALDTYHYTSAWPDIMQRGMRQDFSWSRSAKAYFTIYERLLSPAAQ